MLHTHRPMRPEDVVVGKKFVLHGDDGLYKGVIEEVLRPNNPWKAFVADDGCRYGLDGAFVKVEKP